MSGNKKALNEKAGRKLLPNNNNTKSLILGKHAFKAPSSLLLS